MIRLILRPMLQAFLRWHNVMTSVSGTSRASATQAEAGTTNLTLQQVTQHLTGTGRLLISTASGSEVSITGAVLMPLAVVAARYVTVQVA